ncbi:hypothetical protein BH11MYX2_BH11MYX2_29610 [soil metagenome]
MASTRFFRYLAPNVITLSSMIFGLVSIHSSATQNASLAAWMIIYATLTDRLDGIIARAVKGTSELGMQLDSFADFLNFGIAPAYMVLAFINKRVEMFQSGPYHWLLWIACGGWMLCAVFRLARYNILADDQIPTKIFFGFPTTLAGGMMAVWFLVLLKYDPEIARFGGAFVGAKLFGESVHTPLWAWKVFPIGTAVLGYLMASRLPMPKVGMTRNKLVSIGLMFLVFSGAACGFTQHYPEYTFWMPIGWSIIFLIWGQASSTARAMSPPPLFPKTDPAKPLLRPQGDLEDIVLDESPTTNDPYAAPPAADK